MKNINDTKQKILDESLDMFSKCGFSNISIRNICSKVNIKESSIYYHFKNKQAIFDELIRKFEEKSNDMMKKLEYSLNASFDITNNSFNNICNIYFNEYLMDEFCNKIFRLLTIEQLNNKDIQLKYQYWLFDKPVEFQKRIFGFIIGQKIDCEYLAIKYYSPIFYNFNKYLLSDELTEQKKELFLQKTYNHINKFFEEFYNLVKGE